MTSHRTRTIVAAILGVLTVIVLTVTLTATWARATVVRSEPITRMASDTLAQPEVQAGIATWITEQIAGSVDLEVRLTDTLPDSLDHLAPVLANGANTFVEGTITRALGTDVVQGVLVTIVLSGTVALVAFLIVKYTVGLRVSEEAEREGLDITSHGEAAYES